jgi:integrase
VPWHPDKSTDAWRRLRTLAGVEDVVQHGLRHRKGSQLIDAGIPLSAVSEILGHGNMATTAMIYVHGEAGHEDDAAAVDDDLFA